MRRFAYPRGRLGVRARRPLSTRRTRGPGSKPRFVRCALAAGSICALHVLIFLFGCESSGPGFRPTPGLSGLVRLQGQSEHSGILLAIAGTDSIATTDSTGSFSFSGIPDGRWRIEARYPYFETRAVEAELRGGLLQNRVRVTLRREVQFRVDLPDTVVSVCQCEPSFSVDINCRAKNLTDHSVTLSSNQGQPVLIALRPREGTMSEDCERRFGLFTPDETLGVFSLTLLPGEERLIPRRVTFSSECFSAGRHEVFCVISDITHYPDHFEAFGGLNRSLIYKRELLSPAGLLLLPQTLD